MFAHLVRVALLVELAGWTALATWLCGARGWSAAAAASLAVAGTLGIRLAIVGAAFLFARIAGPSGEAAARLGVAGAVSLVGGEWRAMLANNYLWIPFERLVLRPDPAPGADARVPVIVVHGYFSNRGTVSGLAKALDSAGIGPVFVPSLPAVLAPIETFAAHLDRVVGDVTQATGQPRVILVCHSMGGLVARTYLRSHGPGRVAGLVTLGSPHHGTVLAALGAGANARQMRRGSGFLAGLDEWESGSGPGCPALSIYTRHDNLVAPPESSRLAWARNTGLDGVGHVAMLLDERVHAAVCGEIRRLQAPAA